MLRPRHRRTGGSEQADLDRLNNTSTGNSTSPRLETRGPEPGQRAGAYETTPYPKATHTLGLAPLIDAAPPFSHSRCHGQT